MKFKDCEEIKKRFALLPVNIEYEKDGIIISDSGCFEGMDIPANSVFFLPERFNKKFNEKRDVSLLILIHAHDIVDAWLVNE